MIAAGDYLDGLLARVTGQYSRLGAMLDPLVDRLTILAGAVVCWHFELLPRWALAVLLARELFMLLVGPPLVRRGVELKINWPGRLAGLPVFLYLAFESGDGRSVGSAAIYWLIAAGDYVDGFLARVTGQ